MRPFFRSKFFDFEAIRLLGEVTNGGGEIAEILEAFTRIKENDPKTWQAAWEELAASSEEEAERALSKGNTILARQAYLKASNYKRAAGYMLTGSARHPDPNSLPVNLKTTELFRKAAQLFDCTFRVLEIPYEGYKLPAYLYLPPASRQLQGENIPLVVNTGGADSIQEELYYMLPALGPDLGYAVLTFDGPGQGIMLRKYGTRMRADWEEVTSKVIDHLCSYANAYSELCLDTKRIAIAGASLGGYFALRGAADRRVRACVAIDPIYDMWDFGTCHISPLFIWLWTSGWLSDILVDEIVKVMAKLSFQMKWELSAAGQFFGIDSPSGMLQEMKKYSLSINNGKKSYLDHVTCPVFVSGAEQSLYLDVERHTMRCFRSLGHLQEDERELWIPKSVGQGALQAKMGALGTVNAKVFGFLDRCFNVKRCIDEE